MAQDRRTLLRDGSRSLSALSRLTWNITRYLEPRMHVSRRTSVLWTLDSGQRELTADRRTTYSDTIEGLVEAYSFFYGLNSVALLDTLLENAWRLRDAEEYWELQERDRL